MTFNTLFMLYLMVSLSFISLIWVYSHYRSRRRQFFSTAERLLKCEYCHFSYLEDSSKTLNRCPQCHLLSKDEK